MGRGQLRSVCKGWARPGPAPRAGRVGYEAWRKAVRVKQRGDEVGNDRTELKPVGLPAVREKERVNIG